MTIPLERTNAVIWTEQFLIDLCDPKKTPRVPKIYRDHARMLLRHYPSRDQMEVIAQREDNAVRTLYKIFGKGCT